MTTIPSTTVAGSDLTADDSGATAPEGRTFPPVPHWQFFASVAVFVVLAVVCYWHLWSSHPTTWTQLGPDQFTTIWFLKWVPWAVVHGHNPLYSDYANYPGGVNVLNNTGVPLLAVLTAPVTLVAGPILSYNLLLTAAPALSATAAYVLVRRLVPWRPAAFVGGLLYGFSPYVTAQAISGHLNLTFVVLPPLIFLAVHELCVVQRVSARRWGIILGLLVVAQFFISSEVLASTLVVAAVAVVAMAVLNHRALRAHLRHALVGAAWAGGLAAVLLAYPVWFALRGPASIHGPIQLEPQAYRADLLGPLVPDHYLRLAPAGLAHVADGFANSLSENGSYLGVTLLLALAVTVVTCWRHPVVRVVAVTGAAAFVLSLGANLAVHHPPLPGHGLPLPEGLLAKLPLLDNSVPARYSLYVALAAAVVLAFGLDRLHRAWGQRRPDRRWAGGVLAAVVAAVALVPLVPEVPVPAIGPVAVPTYFTSPAVQRIPVDSVALLVPYPSVPTPTGQLWQVDADFRFKMPGGYFLVPEGPKADVAYNPAVSYTVTTPLSLALVALGTGHPPARTPALLASLRAELRSLRVGTVVAADLPDTAQAVAFLTWMVGRPPVADHDVLAWYQVQQSL